MDQRRFDADRTYRTYDGFTVCVTAVPDEFPWCEYPGSTLAVIDDLCPGLCDEFDDETPYDLPIHKRMVFDPYSITNQGLKPPIIRLLLTRQQKSRIPIREIARMATAWELWSNKPEIYTRGLVDGLEEVTVSVYRDEHLVIRRTLSGISEHCNQVVIDFEHATLEEARTLEADFLEVGT